MLPASGEAFGGDGSGVEVYRVPHASVVDECNFKNIAHAPAQGGAHVGAVEGPGVEIDPGGNFAGEFLHIQGLAVYGAAIDAFTVGYGSQGGIAGLVAFRDIALQINIGGG